MCCHQNVTCSKRFTRYGHYAGEVETITARLAIKSPKIRAFSYGLTMLCQKVVGFVFLVDIL